MQLSTVARKANYILRVYFGFVIFEHEISCLQTQIPEFANTKFLS